MFRSGLFDKSSAAPENSPGRNTICNRFPVGITSLGDDNQNIRIHLAVHKYNSSTSNSTYNKHGFLSPIRHSVSRNSPKAKNYECELDSTLKNESKCGNQYEGVGNFPTVHLEKSSILYRPIKRFIRKGISYPEIPENRFLNHIPQLCSDSRPNARSVLDVLQDLSRKRIHSKSENNYHKKRLQGLGGEAPTNGEVAYKPLFIKKDKTLPISMKDNTTQTILPYFSDSSYNACAVSNLTKNDASDPKAELRKKLAKQNNEIFASLSSSISPIASLKRKIDKISKSRSQILTSKRPKLFDEDKNNCEENGIEPNTNDCSPKTNLKKKLKNGNATSPSGTNKDRLTTIFFDLQNESTNAQLFKNSSTIMENKHSIENNSCSTNKAVAQKNNFSEETGDKQKDTILEKENLSVKQSITPEPESNQNSNLAFNTFQYPFSQSNSLSSSGVASTINSSSLLTTVAASSAPTFNISTKPSDTVSKNILLNSPSKNPTTFFKLSDKSNKTDDTICAGETSIITKQKLDQNDKEIVSKQFVFGNFPGNEVNKPDLNTFKFGFCQDSLTNNISQSINDNVKSINPTKVPTKSDAHQFSFGIKNNINSTPSINSLATIPISSPLLNPSNAVTISSEKPKFTLEKPANAENSLENLNTPLHENENCKNNVPITINSTTSQNQTSSSPLSVTTPDKTYTFGSKSNGKETEFSISGDISVVDKSPGKTESVKIQTPISSQSIKNDSSREDSLISFRTNTAATTETSSLLAATSQSKPFVQTSVLTTVTGNESSLFCNSSDQKFTNPLLSNNESNKSNNNTLTEQKKQSSFSFNFIQNSETQSKGSSLEENGQSKLFTFGQKSKDESCKINNFASSSNLIQTSGQKPSSSATESKLNSLISFGQSNSQGAKGAEHFNQLPSNQTENSNAKTTSALGIKNDKMSFGSVFSQNSTSFSSKTPIFGTSEKNLSSTGFGISNNQPNAIFGISTAASSDTDFKPTTPSTTFGISSIGFASRSNNTFGITSTAQPSNSFEASVTTPPTFTFGTSTTTQASNTFSGTTSTTSQSANTFGLSTTTHRTIFGSSGNQLSNVFAASNTQPTNSFGSNITKVTSTFGTSVTTQSSTGFGSTSSPFEQSFVQNSIKTSTTLGQSPVNIFGQSNCSSNTVTNAFNLPTNSSFSSTTTNNIFGSKSNNEQGSMFGQVLKAQTSPFVQTPVSQSFNVGMSTSTITGFTTSPNTTTSVFTFGASSQGAGFNFGNNLSTSASSTASPFAFNSSSNNTFKLGVSSVKEGSGFGGNNTSTFTFGAQMNNNIPMATKPTEAAFNFGSGPASSTPAFNFSSHSTSPVFSFGGSGSNSSSSTFNFGTPQTGGSFGQPNPSPVATFSAPGTFSIGSGSSQSRQRASSRLRRRP